MGRTVRWLALFGAVVTGTALAAPGVAGAVPAGLAEQVIQVARDRVLGEAARRWPGAEVRVMRFESVACAGPLAAGTADGPSFA